MKRTRTALLVLLVVLATAACVTLAPLASSGTPIPNPAGPVGQTVGDQVQQAKNAADHKVATVQRSIKSQARHLARLSEAASIAEQRFTAQRIVQAQAEATQVAAVKQLNTAREEYQASYQELVASAVSAYESDGAPGSLGSSIGSLLVSEDPNALLTTGAEQQMLADHQANIVTRMTLAVQARNTAVRAEQAALAAVTHETARLNSIRAHANRALAAGQAAFKNLRAALANAKTTQKQADAALSTFLGGWSAADPARAGELNQHYEAIALQVGHAKAAPVSSHWTAAMGQTVVDRALQYLGTPYAWAGGNAAGPTAGICAGGAARHDCHLTGFDCSGLALYAWAPYLGMAHSAETQYGSGSFHPVLTALLPGDLVFWSSNGKVSGIHHVAVYVGDGNVIQAPESGDIVRITPLGSVSSGLVGATRPLS
ncbi:MAG TPA: NlpC/P60 family protein [Jatrophihabitantaceae bacterium]|nr:NlpC/P60 family protein [Jatrophihabitantaceae bacterium]